MSKDKRPGASAKTLAVDVRRTNETWQSRRAAGKAMRESVSRESHADFKIPKDRPDPVDTVIAANVGRQEHLVPLRMARMAASPFAFLRGAAAVMAWDLSRTPVSGIHVAMDGDAHLDNFGLFGTPQRSIVFDLNDFDETTTGPWEWDLKRLAASVNVAARGNGFNRRERSTAVMSCVANYRGFMQRLEKMGVLDIWALHAHPGQESPLLRMDSQSKAMVRRAVEKAGLETNNSLLPKVATQKKSGKWKFKLSPPETTEIPAATRDAVIDGINGYAESLHPEMRYLLGRYHVMEVVHRVVGVGSVGTRAYLAMLFGNGDHDPLFLQVKEAWPSATASFVPPLTPDLAHEGKRVVTGQRALQSQSDPLLGWTSVSGRPFYVRQMKNMKGEIPVEKLVRTPFNFYAGACGAVLARAHARTSDAGAIAGYCGKTNVLDRAIAKWAEAYGDRNEADHAALLAAIKTKRVSANLK